MCLPSKDDGILADMSSCTTDVTYSLNVSGLQALGINPLLPTSWKKGDRRGDNNHEAGETGGEYWYMTDFILERFFLMLRVFIW